jgi:hypothetical protein
MTPPCQPRQRRKPQAAALPANHPGDREPTPAVRPTREAVVEALRRAADPGQVIRVDVTPDESGSYQQQLVTLPGWRLVIMWRESTISHLSQAWGPGGTHWDYGCDRWPNWAVAQAVLLCPIRHLLPPLERAALERRLLAEPCTPPPTPPAPKVSIDDLFDPKYLELFTA